jgi:hypothetical protein
MCKLKLNLKYTYLLVKISPYRCWFNKPICAMRNAASIMLMSVNILFCFSNISAEILWHILGYRFCYESHILAHFCQLLLPSRASKNTCPKAAKLWRQKCWWNWPRYVDGAKTFSMMTLSINDIKHSHYATEVLTFNVGVRQDNCHHLKDKIDQL